MLFGNKRSGTVSDVINYYKFELTISFGMSSNASEVVVLGHSFIEKLEMYAHSEWENLNVDPSKVIVHFKGVSGGNFIQFCSKEFTECLKLPSVKYVICQIGGNDLDSTFRSEATVSTSILFFAELLHYGFDIEQVTMNQLLFRGKTRHIPICEFNRRVVEVNTTLNQAARHLPWLIYWKHKGLKNGNVDPYRNVKVHLNGFGIGKYVLSVRGAVLSMTDCRIGTL